MGNSVKYIFFIFVCLLFIKTGATASPYTGLIEKEEITCVLLEQPAEENNNQQPEEDSENERPLEDDFVGILPSFYQVKIRNNHFYLAYKSNTVNTHISLPYPPPDCL